MKAKLRLLKVILPVSIIVFSAYLLITNIKVDEYQKSNDIRSTANYIEIDEEEEEEIVFVENNDIVTDPIVYDNKTMNELTEQLNKSLSSDLTGKGYLIASYSLEHNVDPYIATAIILQETGCKWGCSYLVQQCNNVGGQKGSGCGSYSYFNSLDEGIMAFIDNLERNYINYGLTTPELMNPKYAEDYNWSANVNKYIEIIKAQ